jgi:hypothetical protein
MGTNIPGAQGKLIGTGKQNTLDILKACPKNLIAARLCDNFVSYDANKKEYSDWFLPSEDELTQLCINKDILGGFETKNYPDVYWMSNEYTAGTGNGQGSNVVGVIEFNSTTTCLNAGAITKSMTARVRAIRYF